MDVNSIGSSYDSFENVYSVSQKKQKPEFDGQKPEPPDIDTMVSKMTAELSLNDNQMIELKKILQNSMSAMDDEMKSMQEQSLDPKSMQSKMKSKMDDMENSIKSILNDEQLQKYNSIIEKRKAKKV